MKTIGGKTYQIGALYEFSRFGKNWFVDVLAGTQPKSSYPYETRSGHAFKHIRVCEVKAGTIEKSPVELIDGECYQYTDRQGMERKGFFIAEDNRLYCTTGDIGSPSRYSNIKLLVVGE